MKISLNMNLKYKWTSLIMFIICRYEVSMDIIIYTIIRERSEEESDTASAGRPRQRARLGPRRNGNRFDHKQTVSYLGHWAALGEPTIECRAHTALQHAGLRMCKPFVGWWI